MRHLIQSGILTLNQLRMMPVISSSRIALPSWSKHPYLVERIDNSQSQRGRCGLELKLQFPIRRQMRKIFNQRARRIQIL